MAVEIYIHEGDWVEEELELSLADLSRACTVDAEWLITLVEEGILEPRQRGARMQFGGASLKRARTVQRLQRDLGVNLAGAALALELLDEIEALRARLAVLEARQ